MAGFDVPWTEILNFFYFPRNLVPRASFPLTSGRKRELLEHPFSNNNGNNRIMHNLVPRAHVSFGQRQDTEPWNNPFPDSKILGLPVPRRMRAWGFKKASRGKSDVDSFHKGIQYAFTSTLSLNTMF